MRCGKVAVYGDAEEVTPIPSTASTSASSSPRHVRITKKRRKADNPYASIGLDRFQSLQDRLTAKRKAVAAKNGVSEDLVKFIHTSKGWTPVLAIKPRYDTDAASSDVSTPRSSIASDDDNIHFTPKSSVSSDDSENDHEHRQRQNQILKSTAQRANASAPIQTQVGDALPHCLDSLPAVKVKPSSIRGEFWDTLRRIIAQSPDYIIGFGVIVIVLLSLALFGKMFAVVCTSLWWYAVPHLGEQRHIPKHRNGNSPMYRAVGNSPARIRVRHQSPFS